MQPDQPTQTSAVPAEALDELRNEVLSYQTAFSDALNDAHFILQSLGQEWQTLTLGYYHTLNNHLMNSYNRLAGVAYDPSTILDQGQFNATFDAFEGRITPLAAHPNVPEVAARALEDVPSEVNSAYHSITNANSYYLRNHDVAQGASVTSQSGPSTGNGNGNGGSAFIPQQPAQHRGQTR